MPLNKHNALVAIRGVMIFIFMYTAMSKLMTPSSFANNLLKASYLDINFIPVLVWLVPGLELVVVLLLVIPSTVRLGLTAGFFLMMLFTTHLVILWHLNPLSPCSCGGLISELTPSLHLWLNMCLIGITLYPMITWEDK